MDFMIRWDLALTARLTMPTNPGAGGIRRRLAMGVAHSGDSLLWIGGALVACNWGSDIWRQSGRRVLLATVIGGGVVWSLKQLFRRRRPSSEAHGLYLALDVHSFPSGHAGRNACVVVSLLPLLSWPWQMGLLLWLGLVGLSRVLLGIHYVADVLAGFLVGGGVGSWLVGWWGG